MNNIRISKIISNIENKFSDGLLGIDFSIKEFLDMIGVDVKWLKKIF